MPFIGRTRELEALNRNFQSGKFQMTVLSGRRRVGKSFLLQEFSKDKKVIFYTAVETSAERNLELFSQSILDVYAPALSVSGFSDYESAFDFLARQAKEEKVVLIIDEYPYLAAVCKGISSILQKYIDTTWLDADFYLILCGSSISFMEEEVLGSKSPLFGRRTDQFRLLPFDYRESALFTPDYSAEDKALIYGVTGGVAKYLSMIDPQKSAYENICDLFFSPNGYLFEEPRNLLSQELRNISLYQTLIEQMAGGANRLKEIADKSHLDLPAVSQAFLRLTELGIIRKCYPVSEHKNKKLVRYELQDNMFRFWYRFVLPVQSAVLRGFGRKQFEHTVQPFLHHYMGKIFEEICRSYIFEKSMEAADVPFLTDIGAWWGNDPELRETADIDLVGINSVTREAVIGECKFRNEPIDMEVLPKLRHRGSLLGDYRIMQYYLFSLGGFSRTLQDYTGDLPLKMVSIGELYQ